MNQDNFLTAKPVITFLLVDTFVTPLVCLFLVPKMKMELKRLLNKKVLENLSREQILLMKYLKNKI